MKINLEILEFALKQRLQYTYSWWRKQNDLWDKKTKFIYNIRTFKLLLQSIETFDNDLKNYALNRWYNFWSAKWIEQIFAENQRVISNPNEYDKEYDFMIDGIKFDHKTTKLPDNYDYKKAKENKIELIKRLYKEQSNEWREHYNNKIFVCTYDWINKEHWKVKAEISLIKEIITVYMNWFNVNNLIELDFGKEKVYADLIWVEKF